MSFDKATRNALAKLVAECRRLLTADIRDQLQRSYGLQPDGTALPIPNLQHLDEPGFEIARELRTWQDHLASTEHGTEQKRRISAFDRLAQETAFTTLNRLAALRLCEERGHILECVRRGKESDGFALYEQLSGGALGARGETYRQFLKCVFDELAQDLGVLFDRRQPQSLVFPGERCLEEVLVLLNDQALRHLWQEDETIGWIYQYYNSQEERRQMRDESAAPRNSRELAVRNQFFTPRYVVEFLTDNTLGRIWYEMTKGTTSLKDKCRYLVRRPTEIFLNAGQDPPFNTQQGQTPNKSQEELLKEPIYIPHRPLKDPREILLLDPACGSMHFGLYAFDLFEVMYEEVWDHHPDLLADLRETITDKREFLILVPKLIIEHNLHGIEIDPRCTQIAGLSLWLRAQKTWQRLGLRLAERPRIARSNIVCAEPMPGEKELLREFSARLESSAIGQLVEMVFDKMHLAGEAGSLLKIEEEITSVVAEAKKLWKQGPKYEQAKLFGDIPAKPEQQEFKLDVSGVTDEQFWERAEDRIYTALREYAEQAQNGSGYERQLFVDDAAQGFAFIDLCRRRYDVILMNPPYGEFSAITKPLLDAQYETSKNDLYAAFVERGLELLNNDRPCLGALTSRTFLNIGSLLEFRSLILRTTFVESLIDLGFNVLDGAVVETCAYTLQKGGLHQRTWCARLFETQDKEGMLSAVLDSKSECTHMLFLPKQDSLSALPNQVFAYWVPLKLLELFVDLPTTDSMGLKAKLGLQTGVNDRFLRLRWEVPEAELGYPRRWVAYAKGGDFSPFHEDIHLVVNWESNGAEIKELARTMYGSETRTVKCQEFYLQPGLTFPLVTVKGINVRLLPNYCICDNTGPGVFAVRAELLWQGLGIMNSRIFQALLSCFTTSRHWQVGYVSKVPFPKNAETVSALAHECFHLRKALDAYSETTAHFTVYPMLLSSLNQPVAVARDLAKAYSLLDDAVTNLYGLDVPNDFLDREVGSVDLGHYVADLSTPISDRERICTLISYSLGCLLGRWDIRFATQEKATADLPDAFAPLPACPPGMLQNEHGLPATCSDVPPSYPLRISSPGILVDDPNHPDDIERRVREAIEVTWKERAEAIEHEACEILAVRSLREYFSKPNGFFADHLKRYSKSRRQAPIYWPLSTASGSYTVWVYYHRFNDDFLYKVVNDYVGPKLVEVERHFVQVETDLQRAAGREATRLRELFEEIKSFMGELQDFKAELLRVTALPYRPNLNDGVLITAAPLWKLFRLPKWRNDLKECWEQLEAGDFDWAHLAYSMWPERVRQKCKSDRSLAIAHGLEQLFETSLPPERSGARRKRKAKAAAPAES